MRRLPCHASVAVFLRNRLVTVLYSLHACMTDAADPVDPTGATFLSGGASGNENVVERIKLKDREWAGDNTKFSPENSVHATHLEQIHEFFRSKGFVQSSPAPAPRDL